MAKPLSARRRRIVIVAASVAAMSGSVLLLIRNHYYLAMAVIALMAIGLAYTISQLIQLNRSETP